MNKRKINLMCMTTLMMILLLSCKAFDVDGSGELSPETNDIEHQIFYTKSVSSYGVMDTIDEMDTVTFGSYPQSDVSGEKKDPIEWIVLAKDNKNGRALILSKYIIDNVSFNDEPGECNWEKCSLRKWLNTTFYENAFDSDEREKIVEVSHISDSFRDNGREVSDKVFLLSSSEVNKYFKKDNMEDENKRLATRGTEYAKNVDNNGEKLWVRENTGEHTFGITEDGLLYEKIVERYKDEALKYEWCIGNSFYWLRTNGIDLKSVARVNSVGGLLEGNSDYSVTQPQGGVRPAIWVGYHIDEEKSEENDNKEYEEIKLGHYKQTAASNNGEWNEDPIEWIVLEKDTKNKKALIVSKYILDTKKPYYKGDSKSITWENSMMREWLNDTFYNEAFSEEEKMKIIKTLIANDDNDDYMTLGGRDTEDKVFLLSINEVRKYFAESNSDGDINRLSRMGAAEGTDYAKSRRLRKIKTSQQDEYEEWMLENSSYFLRSPGGTQKDVAIVEPNAVVYTGGVVASSNVFGIRPAMWVEY